MELIHEEMSQFFDVVNNREFDEIRKRYSNSRVIMYKVSEKIMEFDNMRDRVRMLLAVFKSCALFTVDN